MKKPFSLLMTFMLIVSCFTFVLFSAQAAEENPLVPTPYVEPIVPLQEDESAATELFLHVGSPIALSDGKVLPLDAGNPDLTPFIYKSRTLVPLRMIAEHFGATVDYEASERTAVIQFGEKTARFPVGQGYFTLNGERISLDTETLLSDGRSFVPLRAVCEQVLGLEVGYNDSVISVGRGIKLDDALTAEVKGKIGAYVKVGSLAALKGYLSSPNRDAKDVTLNGILGADAENVEPVAVSSPAPALTESDQSSSETGMGGSAREDHSDTNVQVEGVDEGDIIKTDGRYIYIVAGQELKIVDTNGGTMKMAAEVHLGDGIYAQEMYIDQGRVAVVGTCYRSAVYAADSDSPETARKMIEPAWRSSLVNVQVFDTSNMSDVKELRSFEIEGYITASRKKDGYLYLVTTFSNWYAGGDDPRPLWREDGELVPIPLGDILVMPEGSGTQFLTLSAINVLDADKPIESETIAGSGYTTYMSSDTLYVAMYDDFYGQGLNIARFSAVDGLVGYRGSGAVEGSLNSQYSMDEYDGYLRVATTVWDWEKGNKNNLYVLDENMEVCGSVLGFAEGESIYSVRYMGARGYVVTFKQVDPLFAFDLSDPTHPVIMGQLKVPGFSSYLHPISDTVLLGVGQDVYDIYKRDKNGQEVVIGQRTGGLKISLFDVSDFLAPREIDNLIIGDQGYSELLYNPRSAMFKTSESLLAFPADLYSDTDSKDSFNGALFISYAGNRLSEYGRIEYINPYGNNSKEETILYTGERVVYIGNTYYYMQDGLLRSFNAALKEQQALKLTPVSK